MAAQSAEDAWSSSNNQDDMLRDRTRRRWPEYNGCVATISIAIADQHVYRFNSAVKAALLETLEGRAPSITSSRYRMTVGFFTKSDQLKPAIEEAESLIASIVAAVGGDDSSAREMRVHLPAEHGTERLPQPSDNPLLEGVGVGEAAEILGVTKQRVHQLTQSASFPEPILKLRATPVWRRADVEEFGRHRKIKPGPARLR